MKDCPKKFHSCPWSFASSGNCSFFGQYFSLGYYPPIYQLLKGVYLLNIHICLCMHAYIYTYTYTYYNNYKLECSIAIFTTEKDLEYHHTWRLTIIFHMFEIPNQLLECHLLYLISAMNECTQAWDIEFQILEEKFSVHPYNYFILSPPLLCLQK